MQTSSHVDLLIIGAGPAGLMMATWASKFGIRTRIIDEKHARVSSGRADGLQSRTLEILHSFGLSSAFLQRSVCINEICLWNADDRYPDEICRTQTVAAQPPGLSMFPQMALNQGAIEQILENYLTEHASFHIERDKTAVWVKYHEHAESVEQVEYPVQVGVRNDINGDFDTRPESDDPKNKVPHEVNNSLGPDAKSKLEIINTKYMVACDGGHSLVRSEFDIALEGDEENAHFGVMDIVPLTDFPDIRESCIIHSIRGSIMTIPRENRLVRLYIQLKKENCKTNDTDGEQETTPKTMLYHVQKIFYPYKIDFRICDWFSVYKVGQRLATSFQHGDHIFLAGDAVHTHSPTLGQGMNISMQDAYNLGWKLGSVLTGKLPAKSLGTYNEERRSVAEHLMKLDRDMTEFYSKGPHRESKNYSTFRTKFSRFVSGISVTYDPSILTYQDSSEHVSICKDIQLGQRIPSEEIVSQSEGRRMQLADILSSNGKWRVVVFPGRIDIPELWDRTQKLGTELHDMLQKVSHKGQSLHSIIEVMLIHSAPRRKISMLDLHIVYHPWDDEKGWDYWKVFCEPEGPCLQSTTIYDKFAISRSQGCMLLIRPDHHISCILPIFGVPVLERFLSELMQLQ